MWKIREKWARAYLPWRFTGSTRTTSRAEAINSLIKQYVSSKNEVPGFINFISNFEKKSIYDNFKVEKEIFSQYESRPVINDLESTVFDTIFDNHFNEFTLAHNYFVKVLETKQNIIIYEAKSILAKDVTKSWDVMNKNGKYNCSCDVFIREGLVCRHVLALANVNQDKTLGKFDINKRWQPPLMNSNEFNLKIDNYSFDSNLVSKYLNKNICPIEKKEVPKEEERENSFKAVVKGKGTPRKKKRMKSPNEKRKKTRTKVFFI